MLRCLAIAAMIAACTVPVDVSIQSAPETANDMAEILVADQLVSIGAGQPGVVIPSPLRGATGAVLVPTDVTPDRATALVAVIDPDTGAIFFDDPTDLGQTANFRIAYRHSLTAPTSLAPLSWQGSGLPAASGAAVRDIVVSGAKIASSSTTIVEAISTAARARPRT